MILPLGKVPWQVSSPQVASQMEVLVLLVPPPSRTLLAVWELEVVLVRVPRCEAGEALRVQMLVAVDDGRGDLLGHAFEEGFDFGQAGTQGCCR